MSARLAGVEGLPGAHYIACALWRFPTEEAARQYARDLHGATT